jgi:hypothetical protein
MNEAERYLEEKLNPTLPKKPDAGIKAGTSVVSEIRVPRDEQPSPFPQKGGSAAGKYIFAVLACLAIFGVYVAIAASMGWRRGGGYVVMVIVFMAMIGTWKAITSK